MVEEENGKPSLTLPCVEYSDLSYGAFISLGVLMAAILTCPDEVY